MCIAVITLIQDAVDMLRDRTKEEQDLIYSVAKLDADERQAIILAYRLIHDEDFTEREDDATKRKTATG